MEKSLTEAEATKKSTALGCRCCVETGNGLANKSQCEKEGGGKEEFQSEWRKKNDQIEDK